MAKYIDVEKLLGKIYYKSKRYLSGTDCSVDIYGFVKSDIESECVVDAVEVVRCKDCKFYHKQECAMDDWHFSETKENDFCSFGQKKEATDNG